MSWRQQSEGLPESAQKPLRAAFTQLAQEMGNISAAVYNYDAEARRNTDFPKNTVQAMALIRGRIDYLEIGFMKVEYIKDVLTFGDAYAQAKKEWAADISGSLQGRSIEYRARKHEIEVLFLAIHKRFSSLSLVFKKHNFFEEDNPRLRAEDIPDE